MTIQRDRSNAQAQPQGTRQRVVACRKRLRQRRALRKAVKLSQDEAVVAANEILALVSDEADFLAGENEFDRTGAPTTVAGRRFTPEVDRRARLRAR